MNVTNTTSKIDVQTTSTQTTQATSKNADTASFKDTLSSADTNEQINAEVKAENKNQQDVVNEKKDTKSENDFEFISRNLELKDGTKNKKNAKIAKKELVDEIILINSNQSNNLKPKNNQQLSQAVSINKSDKELENNNDNKNIYIPEELLSNQKFNQRNFEFENDRTKMNKSNKNDVTIIEEKNSKLNAVLDEFENPVKNKIGDVNIAQDEMDLQQIKEMKVLTFEPIVDLLEINRGLTTNKTNDIVSFIDANLSTNNSSRTKTSSTSQTSSTQSSSEKISIKMTESDAKFFNSLIENNEQVMQGVKVADAQQNLNDIEQAKSVEVSKTLLNALKESQENNKSFRVDFDKDLSVILKVNKDGQISAEFLPGDKAVEQYLKTNMPLLKQRFNEEGLEYENLSYKQSKKEKEEEKRNSRGNNKENGYE
ncbi:MAG: hypothetical protein ACI4SM_03790 [Candidatus Gastranaerophilaceae bacterium]